MVASSVRFIHKISAQQFNSIATLNDEELEQTVVNEIGANDLHQLMIVLAKSKIELVIRAISLWFEPRNPIRQHYLNVALPML